VKPASVMLPAIGAEDDYVTVAQLADELGIHEMTLWEWVRKAEATGTLTRYKRERDTRTYLKRDEIKSWSRETPPPSPPKPHIYKPRLRHQPAETERKRRGK
jgi:transposase-like protein